MLNIGTLIDYAIIFHTENNRPDLAKPFIPLQELYENLDLVEPNYLPT
jgi:hypothetical protein